MAIYYPPSSRFTNYEVGVLQGVVGGIPTRTNQINITDYGWSAGASAAANRTAWDAAKAASAVGDVIVIPAGTFNVTQLFITKDDVGRSWRGAGYGQTIIRPTGDPGITIGFDFNSESAPSSTITSLSKDSAVITVADGSGFPSPASRGQYRIGRITLLNEAVTPVVSVYGYPSVRSMDMLMVSRSGNNITLSQPLPSSFADSVSVGNPGFTLGFQLAWNTYGVGLEDMTIDMVNGSTKIYGVRMSMCEGSWVTGVNITNGTNYGIDIADCVNCEISGCGVDGSGGGGSNGGGIRVYNSCFLYIYNNWCVGTFPELEMNAGFACNIVAYNYTGGQLITNHDPHPSFNLYEGNRVSNYFQSDGYRGGESQTTFFRNLVDRLPQLNRFSRQMNILGNVTGNVSTEGSAQWGDPNIGNNDSIGTAEPSTNDWWAAFNTSTGGSYAWTGTLTTRTNATSGVITLDTGMAATFNASLAVSNGVVGTQPINFMTVVSVVGNAVTITGASGTLPALNSAMTLYPAPTGYQEKDLDVENTVIRGDNYTANTSSITDPLTPDVLPDSYYLTEKPVEFGSLEWPPYNPYAPAAYTGEEIPAGYRYVHGTDPPDGTVTFGGSGSTTFGGSGTVNFA